ncbi:IS66 family insertion sequence element accessory protein TnpA [Desulfonatronum parangueonense]
MLNGYAKEFLSSTFKEDLKWQQLAISRASGPAEANCWHVHVVKRWASGLSQAEYSRKFCFVFKSLGYWKRRFERGRQPIFSPVLVPRQHLVPPTPEKAQATSNVEESYALIVKGKS